MNMSPFAILPDYWVKFITGQRLETKRFSIPWLADDDGAAGDHELRLLDESESQYEATELWPGKRILRDGYVPVGADEIGTGDQYFINVNDGPAGPLYQVDHEQVFEDGYEKDEAISIVLTNYEDLVKHVVDD
jgi:hypothetical protein